MKRLAGYTAVVLATLGVVVILWQFRSVLILFLLSLVVAAAVRPLVARLVEKGVPAGLALLIVYVVGLAGLILTFYLIGRQLLDELRILSNNFVVFYDQTYVTWQGGTSIQDAIADRLPAPGDLSNFVTSPEGRQLAQALLGVTQGVAAAIAGLGLIIVLSIYWSADQNHFERLWLSVLPAGQRVQARRMWRNMEGTIGNYVRSEFVQAIFASVILGLGYWIIGLAYPVLLALLGGFTSLIPLAGGVVIVVAALLVGLATGGVVSAVIAATYTILTLLFLEFIIEPRLFSRQRYSGLLMILLMLPLVYSYGLIGFVIAPPVAVVVQLLLSNLMRLYLQPQPAPALLEFEQLESRYQELLTTFKEKEDGELPPEIANILERLEGLIDEARQLAPEG